MKFPPHSYGIPMKCVWDSYKVPMKILRNAYELKMFHWNFFEILMIWSYAAIWPRLAGFCNADMRCDHAWNAIWRHLAGFCDADMRFDHAWDAIWPRLVGFRELNEQNIICFWHRWAETVTGVDESRPPAARRQPDTIRVGGDSVGILLILY